MLRSPHAFLCSWSCVHVTTSQNSSSVPNPPGRAMKPSRDRPSGLAFVHGFDDSQIFQMLMCHFLVNQEARDDANDVATMF